MNPSIQRRTVLRAALATPDVNQAVDAFAADWLDTYGTDSLP